MRHLVLSYQIVNLSNIHYTSYSISVLTLYKCNKQSVIKNKKTISHCHCI